MTDARQANHIDFIEFPATSLNDLHRAKAFYREVFGWQYTDWGENYSDTGDSGLGSGINADESHRPAHSILKP